MLLKHKKSSSFNIEDTDVVILCGGRGERLRSLINDRPKPLAEINGKPFLDILIDYAAGFGFKRFILCAGYMGDMIEDYYKKKSAIFRILISNEKGPLGTAGAIKNAEPFIKSSPFLVLNGDSICRLNLHKFLKFHAAKKAMFSIALSKMKNSGDYGNIILDTRTGRIKAFKEKSELKNKVGFVNAGIYILDKSIFSHIQEGKKSSLEYDIFPKLTAMGLYGFISDKAFIDIGTPERFKKAKKLR